MIIPRGMIVVRHADGNLHESVCHPNAFARDSQRRRRMSAMGVGKEETTVVGVYHLES